MITRVQILGCVAMLGMAGSAGAATIINGSFEDGVDPGSFSSQTAGSTAITGWTVAGFGVDYIGNYWQASDGVRSVDLSYLSAGSVSQAIDTVAGTDYTVTFDLSGNPDGAPLTKTVFVSIGGSLPQLSTYTVGPTNTHESMNWQSYSYTFTAFDSLSTLVFSSADYGPYGAAIDNVSIIDGGGGAGSFVPEPSAWAMMVVGFGLVGVSTRRRKGRTVAA